jgi:septal ring factor EnvC (AmiA/AmiB activator)
MPPLFTSPFKFLFYIFLPVALFAQSDLEKKISQNRSILQEIDQEIADLRRSIKGSQSQEGEVSDELQQVDRNLALTARKRGLLENEKKLLERKLEINIQENNQAEAALLKLTTTYTRRLIHSYKFGRLQNLELIFSAKSLNQAMVRYKYLQFISKNDERLIRSIRTKKQDIEVKQANLLKTREQQNLNLSEQTQAEEQYSAIRLEKNQLLRQMKQSRKQTEKILSSKEQEREKIASIILALEKMRKEREKTPARNTTREEVHFDFADIRKAKGKLPWPVRGKVVSGFGKVYDSASKTYLRNTGIEIASPLGTAVSTVFSGVVRTITYLPVYGNTVIIEHGHGFYTVYAHLDQVFVSKNETVNTNQQIGTVGDSGSQGTTKLGFELYGSEQTIDPLTWLGK